MISLRFLLLTVATAIAPCFLFAESNPSRVLYVDPKHDGMIPIYSMNKNGKRSADAITQLAPGDFISLKRITADGSWVVRGKDGSGQDIDLVIDPKDLKNENGDRVVTTSAPQAQHTTLNGKKIVGTLEPGLGPTYCTLADAGSCQTLESGTKHDIEDAAIVLKTSELTGKESWELYYKTKVNNKETWIDAEQTEGMAKGWSTLKTPAKQDAEAPVPEKDCDPNDPKLKEQQTMGETADALAKKSSEENQEIILQHVGDCLQKPISRDDRQRAVDNMASKKLPALSKQEGNEVVPATKADWVAIDIMARTLYAEMADCFDDGKQYPESVAKIVTNRVDFSAEYPTLAPRFIKASEKSNARNEITNAILKKDQFEVWWTDKDVHGTVMCPPSKPGQKLWNGKEPNQEEMDIWKEAVRISSQAVLEGKSFRDKNKDMKALYYTSQRVPMKSGTMIKNASLGGERLQNYHHCLSLWKLKELEVLRSGIEENRKNSQLFHPYFLQAFQPVAGL